MTPVIGNSMLAQNCSKSILMNKSGDSDPVAPGEKKLNIQFISKEADRMAKTELVTVNANPPKKLYQSVIIIVPIKTVNASATVDYSGVSSQSNLGEAVIMYGNQPEVGSQCVSENGNTYRLNGKAMKELDRTSMMIQLW